MLKRFHIAAIVPVPGDRGRPRRRRARGRLRPRPGLAHATFAGGCFWCMEGPFDDVPGVVSTTSGYTGGSVKEPTLRAGLVRGHRPRGGGRGRLRPGEGHATRSSSTCSGTTWIRSTAAGSSATAGNQYRTAIFYHDEEQQRLAEQSKQALEASGKLKKKIVTQIVPAGEFYAAEDYHQDYYMRNPIRYKFYRFNCGRDDRLKELWGEAPAH